MNKISKQSLILLSVGLISYLTTYNLPTPIQSTVLFCGSLMLYVAIFIHTTHYILKTIKRMFNSTLSYGDDLDIKKEINDAIIVFLRVSVSISFVMLMTSIAVEIS